jgi:hypothetical protein
MKYNKHNTRTMQIFIVFKANYIVIILKISYNNIVRCLEKIPKTDKSSYIYSKSIIHVYNIQNMLIDLAP